ncbi:hypothetical protein GCM10025760_00110 [Microbacterium yannicii]|uniref:Polysaccharide chain length determinant N-terminal domain-containing protein n=1 Tax=Microbacterium yannicii TaxID=671622 RepID=A0ABP9LRS9_9MICO|nr:hypothetical protein [Microbacterium yannicii]MCO5952335.1 hypothetical protein [Microbacterium yannicii]
MTLADTLRGLLRRWYIVLPGIILALAVALGTFFVVKPGYERTATQLLLPGAGTIPEGATNPYLFLGSLAQAADIVVRAMGSDEVAGEVVERYPGIDIQVARDPLVSGPVIQFTVTADSDEEAAGAIDLLLERSATTLEGMQADQGVRPDDQITSSVLTKDTESTLEQKSRLMLTAVAGGVLILITLVVASLVDGLSRRQRTNGRSRSMASSSDDASAATAEDASRQLDEWEAPDAAPAAEEPLPAEPAELSDTQEILAIIMDEPADAEAAPVRRPGVRAKRGGTVER